MGYGDEIMASGHARSEHQRTGKRVKILDAYGRPRWDALWAGLPWIAQPGERGDFATIRNGPQCRPYIAYPFTRLSGQRWTSWRARDHVGAIAFSAPEQAFAAAEAARLGEFFVIEPSISSKSNPNKNWGRANWAALAELLRRAGFTVVQMGAHPDPVTRDVEPVETRTFREAAALLAHARAAVLPEGGLHHAAAVLGVRAVVLFGGHISPETTGYPQYVNLVDDGEGSPCGRWQHCRHCADIWKRLKPEQVLSALGDLLGRKADAA